MEASVDPLSRGPDWKPITPKTGSLLHAETQDPGSAKFGEIRASVDNRGSVGICGIVNAKNSNGGYIGNHPFAAILADGKVAHVIVDSPSDPTKIVREACRNIAPSLTW